MRTLTSAFLCGSMFLGLLTIAATRVQAQPMITLQEGDIIVLDGSSHTVYHVDPVTKNETALASGTAVWSPRGVALSPEGLLYVSDTFNDWLVRIDPFSGGAIPIFSFITSGPPPYPDPAAAVADAESDWDILVVEADQRQIVRIDPVLGFGGVEFNLVGTNFPIGLTRDPTDQTLVVADRFPGTPTEQAGIYRVDPDTNSQSAISLSDDYLSLRRVAVQSDGDIFVTDRGSGGSGKIVYRIPAGSSLPEVFGSQGGTFDGPQGVAVDPADDSVLVADFTAGAVYRLNAAGTTKELVNDQFSGPFDVIVVPALTPRRHDQFLISEANPGGTTGQVYLADSDADSRAPIPASGGAAFTNPRAMAFEHPDDTLTSGGVYVIDGPTSVVRRDLASGAQTAVSTGGDFDDLVDIAVEYGDPLGDIVVVDGFDGQVIRVDPAAMTQSVVNSIPGTPTSIVVDGNGSMIITAKELDDDGDTSDDSGLFRVNPISGEVVQFVVTEVITGSGTLKFLDPFALALEPNGDVLLIDRGGTVDMVVVPPKIFRVQGTNGPFATAVAFSLSTAADPSLPDAVAMIVDGNRDAVVAYDAPEPSRIDLVSGSADTLTVGGNFNLATDILFEGMPAPGDPIDTDSDGVPDGFDNCSVDPNPGQEDSDSDGFGDVCQLFDVDLDGWSDFNDNCPFLPNNDQADTDSDGADGVGDVCDNCPDEGNADQRDFNGNGVGDACEDSDLDGVLDLTDVCPDDPDPGQADEDNDGVGDLCDNCPNDFDADQSDLNEDGIGDVCQPGDSDGDGIPDDGGPAPCDSGETVACDDNCPNDANSSQSDVNDDGVGDICQDGEAGPDSDFDGWPDSEDNCPDNFNPSQSDLNEDGVGDICQNALAGPDSDLDGIPDDGGPAVCANGATVGCDDNCVDVFNPTQSDLNEDGEGDACQSGDLDNDGIPDDGTPGGGPTPCPDGVTLACDDNCPINFNPDQSDANGDQIGDACQPDDIDADGWPDTTDNCPYYPNNGQEDVDSDGVGDVCDNDTDTDGLVDVLDNCPFDDNIGQEDGDSDGAGDVCDNCGTLPNGILAGTCSAGLVGTACQEDTECDSGMITGVCSLDQEDVDSDGSGDVCDNCVTIANGPDAYAATLGAVSQCDSDSDGYGNACDGDFDVDGFVTPADNALYLAALALFFPPPPGDTDMNCDGFMTPADNSFYLAQLSAFFPGPSGWACAGTAICPPTP